MPECLTPGGFFKDAACNSIDAYMSRLSWGVRGSYLGNMIVLNRMIGALTSSISDNHHVG